MYPTTNLQPGATGAEVKKLQDYLVSKGFMTQVQVDTGYGTYGPQTTAAVKALQESLGVDNSTGPGYWGPRTIAAVSPTPTSVTTSGDISNTELSQILSNPSLSNDQKAVIQATYGAISSNDTDTASRLQAAMAAASKYSDPYFKAQIQLTLDALNRGLGSKEGDLAFSEKQNRAALDKLRADTEAAKGQLSFQHSQELQQLSQKYENDLSATRQSLAASGFASSSRRARAEEILANNNQGLVESSNKQFGYQTGNLDRALASGETGTAAQIANLQRLADEGKLDLYRTAESSVGSSNLPSLSGLAPVGDIGGTIPRQQATDAFSFASNFVF
jgi:hypothetical protein